MDNLINRLNEIDKKIETKEIELKKLREKRKATENEIFEVFFKVLTKYSICKLLQGKEVKNVD